MATGRTVTVNSEELRRLDTVPVSCCGFASRWMGSAVKIASSSR